MNFNADDYLAHHGVKGMKWHKHKYKRVLDANGNPIYMYYTGQKTTAAVTGKFRPKNKGDLPVNKLGFSQPGTKNEAIGYGGKIERRRYTPSMEREKTGTAKPLKTERDKSREAENAARNAESTARHVSDTKTQSEIKAKARADESQARHNSAVKYKAEIESKSRAAESTARHKSDVQKRKKNKAKKIVSNGKRFIEGVIKKRFG